MTGELTILASRYLNEAEFPDLLAGEAFNVKQIELEGIKKLASDPRRKYGLVQSDDGWQLHVHAACFAQGKAKLDHEKIYDLLARIDIRPDYTPPITARDALARVMSKVLAAGDGGEFDWTPSKNSQRQQVRCRGLRITVKLWKAWVVASRVIEAKPGVDPAQILSRTLGRNATQSGPDFFYSRSGQISARMTHSMFHLGASELCCMLRELAALPALE